MANTHENQFDINRWQKATFPDATIDGIINHLKKEFAEFLEAAEGSGASEEAADVILLLYAWAGNKGINLHDFIDMKMKKNRARQWDIKPDGTGRHT